MMRLNIAVISLVTIVSFLCGYGFAKSGKEEIKRELIGVDSELAYRIHHACGKGYEMYDWSVVKDAVLVDCTTTGNGVSKYYTTKTVSIER